nr:hypothetical protein [Tanacetum cinerariifolium]
APDKVTITDLFYLRGMGVGSVNVHYLLSRYLRLFSSGRKQGAMISGGHARHEGDAGSIADEALVAPGEEEVHGMRKALQGQREVLDSMAREFFRFTTWTVTSLERLMDRVGVPYTRYSESPIEYQRRTR